jgi:cytochrome c biogenesis protein CcmG, thiol:disulfide interchange protein DsbE
MDAASAPEVNLEKNKKSTTNRLVWIVAFVALIGLLALVGWRMFTNRDEAIGIGAPVPNFTVTTFDGQQINLADHQGKVIVLNFWASWCKPCEQEAADLEAAWRLYKDRGDVLFLGVDYVDTEPEALGYLEKFDITFPNGPDLGTRISQSFRIRGVPETYFIDQQGRLADFQIGPFSSLNQIRAKIDVLLGE